MRTRIVNLLRRRATEPTGGTRTFLPSASIADACRHYGYPAAEGVDWNELSAHFKVRRSVGEPV